MKGTRPSRICARVDSKHLSEYSPPSSDETGWTNAPSLPQSILFDPERRLCAREVAGLLGVGLTTLSTMIANGGFPAPERIGLASVSSMRHRRWRRADVLLWLENQDRSRVSSDDR